VEEHAKIEAQMEMNNEQVPTIGMSKVASNARDNSSALQFV
jgi:hypothetical protein